MLRTSFLRDSGRAAKWVRASMVVVYSSLVLLAACDHDQATAPDVDAVTAILLSESSLDMTVGETMRLEATVIGKNGKPMPSTVPLEWSSSKPDIASVDEVGLVLAKNRGSASVTVAKRSGQAAVSTTVPVTVRDKSEPEDPGEEDPEDDEPDNEPEPEDPDEEDPEDEPDTEPEPEPPVSSFSFACSDMTCDFTDQSTADAEITAWSWDFGDENGADTQNPQHTYAEAGTYTVKLTVTDDVGGTGTASQEVNVTEPEPDDPPEDNPDPPDFGEWDFVLADTTVQSDVVVPDGQRWLIGPNVQVAGNVRTVNGTIAMRPGSTLKFLGANPDEYVGGGMHYAPEFARDIGLWVGGHMANGVLDISCTPKQGWNRTGTHATWKPTDEYWIAPTDVEDFEPRRWYPGDPIPRVDPRVPPTEVMNVTRDCVIEGPAHIHIHSQKPQSVKYVRLERMGIASRQHEGEVLGRYALHFHMSGNGSRGTIVQGVAATNSMNWVYVPHASHGITMIDNVSVNSFAEGFNWDDGPGHETHDILVDRLAVSGVHMPREVSGSTSRRNAVALPQGTNMTMRNSAVSGAHGNRLSNGFHWETSRTRPSSWNFTEGNVSHNNQGAGLRFWTNTRLDHHIQNAISYRDGKGIDNGAYVNAIRWTKVFILEAKEPLLLHANSRDHEHDGEGQKYRNVYAHSREGPAITIGNRNLEAKAVTEFIDSEFHAAPGQPKVFVTDGKNPWVAHFIRSGVVPDDIVFEVYCRTGASTDGNEGSHILIDHEDGRKWEIVIENCKRVVRAR